MLRQIDTMRNLTEAEAREILSEMGLDFDSPDNETHDRHGVVASWDIDDQTVYVLYSNDDNRYSITDASL